MTRLTVDGQALELDWVRSNRWRLNDADYLKMVELKTSWYTFITPPLQAGAIAAGAAPDRMEPLESFGRHLGAAFQITDDLLNLRGDPEEYGKEIGGGDIWEASAPSCCCTPCGTPNHRIRLAPWRLWRSAAPVWMANWV